jgi:hypothetical protein
MIVEAYPLQNLPKDASHLGTMRNNPINNIATNNSDLEQIDNNVRVLWTYYIKDQIPGASDFDIPLQGRTSTAKQHLLSKTRDSTRYQFLMLKPLKEEARHFINCLNSGKVDLHAVRTAASALRVREERVHGQCFSRARLRRQDRL